MIEHAVSTSVNYQNQTHYKCFHRICFQKDIKAILKEIQFL